MRLPSSPYSVEWRRQRAAFLRAHPLCRMCQQAGRLTPASVVDHVQPHKGDVTAFWDQSNWQPLCAPCHNGAKQGQERTGRVRGCDASGTPNDPGHYWNR